MPQRLYIDKFNCGHPRTEQYSGKVGFATIKGVRQQMYDCRVCRKTRAAQPMTSAKRYERALMSTYGIDLRDLEAIRELHDYRCACCGIEERHAQRGKLLLDHCHTCGELCALLCHSCNVNNYKDTFANLKRKLVYRSKHEMLCQGPRVDGRVTFRDRYLEPGFRQRKYLTPPDAEPRFSNTMKPAVDDAAPAEQPQPST